MTIYRGVGGVNREIKKEFRGVGGINREIKEQYRCVGGVNRKVFVIEPTPNYVINFADSNKFTKYASTGSPAYSGSVMCGEKSCYKITSTNSNDEGAILRTTDYIRLADYNKIKFSMLVDTISGDDIYFMMSNGPYFTDRDIIVDLSRETQGKIYVCGDSLSESSFNTGITPAINQWYDITLTKTTGVTTYNVSCNGSTLFERAFSKNLNTNSVLQYMRIMLEGYSKGSLYVSDIKFYY